MLYVEYRELLSGMNGMKEKVLIVDDEPLSQISLRGILAGDFEVRTASDAREALGLLESEGPFAVAVSDLVMPGMSGVDFLAEIERLYPETVRVAYSATSDIETALGAVNRSHVYAFLRKNDPALHVLHTIRLAAQRHRHAQGGAPSRASRMLSAEEIAFLTDPLPAGPPDPPPARSDDLLTGPGAQFAEDERTLDLALGQMLAQAIRSKVPLTILRFRTQRLPGPDRRGDAARLAARIARRLRNTDTVGVLNDGEIIALLWDTTSAEAGKAVMSDLGNLLEQGATSVLSGAWGLSQYPDDGSDAATLLDKAARATHRLQ